MAPPNIPPAWPKIFLDRLALSGNAMASAEAAGVDVSSAYNRRQRYPGFRDAWVRVLAERERRAGGLLPPLSALADGESPSTAEGRGGGGAVIAGTTASGAKLIRTGAGRWSAAAEERFLVELSASASIKRAAQAAGFSQVTIYRRRLKQRAFATAWDAAIDTGKARVEALMVEAAGRAFDPDQLPISDGLPKVSVAEAISISRRAGSGARGAGKVASKWETDGEIDENEVAEASERIMSRLARMRTIMDNDRLAKGFTLVDGDWIPPGWVRSPR